MPLPEVVLLYASVSADMVAKGRTDELQKLFDLRDVPYALLDATYEPNRELRNQLFAVSGHRAVYPQVFLRQAPGNVYEFVGLYAAVHELNERNAETGAFDAAFAAAKAAGAGGGAGGGDQSPAIRHMDATGEGAFAANAPAAAAAAAATPVVAAATGSSSSNSSASVAAGSAPTPAAPVVDGWARCTDAASGDVFWWHAASRQASWVDPAHPAPAGGAAASGAPASIGTWVRQWDDRRGRAYWYDWATGKSAWRLPKAGAAPVPAA